MFSGAIQIPKFNIFVFCLMFLNLVYNIQLGYKGSDVLLNKGNNQPKSEVAKQSHWGESALPIINLWSDLSNLILVRRVFPIFEL